MKKVFKKTGKIITAPVRVPAKKIKHHRQHKKERKQLEKAIENAFKSEEFMKGVEDFTNAITDIIKEQEAAAKADPEVIVIEPEPAVAVG